LGHLINTKCMVQVNSKTGGELPNDLKLQTRKTDKKYWYYYPRIRDTKSRFYKKKGDVFECNGIFFDIFLLEPVPSMKFKRDQIIL